MGCPCKEAKKIAKFDKKVNGKKETISNIKDAIINNLVSIILRLFAIVFTVILCPVIIVYVVLNILIGTNKITIKFPRFIKKWFIKKVNEEKK